MTDKKIIAVVGSTGAQGGGLACAILADPEGPFALRAITRNPGSDNARELARLGAEVVKADLGDELSVRKSFQGAHGAYIVTNYWELMSGKKEVAQAEAGARAAKDAGVNHVIWSTLEDTRQYLPTSDTRVPTLEGTYTVPHFDAKSEANALFANLGVPTTFLQTTFYWEAFTAGFGPVRDRGGHLVLTLPMGDRKLAGIAAEDIGRTALGIFRRGDEYIGRTVSIAGEHLTGAEYAQAFTEELGEPVVYCPLSHDEFRALELPVAKEAGNMFQYYYEAADYFTGVRDIEAVRRLNPQLQTFRTWLRSHKDAIPLG
jgi:uncharacterized protein YbjT (DUF2867 family)